FRPRRPRAIIFEGVKEARSWHLRSGVVFFARRRGWRRSHLAQEPRVPWIYPGVCGVNLLRGLAAFGQAPVLAREVAGVAVGDALQIILVLGLGEPERSNRRHFRHHLAGPQAGGLDILDGVE